MTSLEGRSPPILSVKQRAVKDFLPGEVLDQASLFLSREDVDAVQISCRYFRDLTSTDGFGKKTPLRLLEIVQLINDHLTVWRNGIARRFGMALIDSEYVVRWLRNACVKSLCLVNTAYLLPEQRRTAQVQAERALRWFIAHRSVFRVIGIIVKLPLDNDELLESFLRPDTSHQWTLASVSSDVPGTLPLTSSSLENVEQLFIDSAGVVRLVQVTVDEVIRWLHRPASPFVKCRTLHFAFENIEGEPQRLLEAVRENFIAATTSREFIVKIDDVHDVFLLASVFLNWQVQLNWVELN